MIGSDIIDLQLAEKESDWQRPGFLDKQFTEVEQDLISQTNNPFQLVWLLWSMKEAAYKIWAQQNGVRKYSPKKFQCTLLSDDEGVVLHGKETYYTTSILDGYFIQTVACINKSAKSLSWIGPPFSIEKNLKKMLEKETGIKASEIEKKKSKIGVPNFYHKEIRLTKSCSLSHHGNYGTFSLLLN